jgi:hypothetical protein
MNFVVTIKWFFYGVVNFSSIRVRGFSMCTRHRYLFFVALCIYPSITGAMEDFKDLKKGPSNRDDAGFLLLPDCQKKRSDREEITDILCCGCKIVVYSFLLALVATTIGSGSR